MSPRTFVVVVALSAGCSLFKLNVQTQTRPPTPTQSQPAEPQPRRGPEEVAAAEQAREDAVVAEIEALRAELKAGVDAARAIKFADRMLAARDSAAARDGRIDLNQLQPEALGYLDAALTAAPSLELLLALDRAAPGPGGDPLVQEACPQVRPVVTAESLAQLVELCLGRSGGDVKQLRWASARADVQALRKARDAEAKAAAQAEKEAARVAEAAARSGAWLLAGVFAAGRCEFGDCLKQGWVVQTAAGDMRVRCEFSDCLKNGWVADLPGGGGDARSRCEFSDCMKNGWQTSFPDGSNLRSRCEFSDCAKNGWQTELPGGVTARSRCEFSDCFTNGWTTEMPGSTVRCSCNFRDCLKNGASCG
jgi:hypothetical protein